MRRRLDRRPQGWRGLLVVVGGALAAAAVVLAALSAPATPAPRGGVGGVAHGGRAQVGWAIDAPPSVATATPGRQGHAPWTVGVLLAGALGAVGLVWHALAWEARRSPRVAWRPSAPQRGRGPPRRAVHPI